MRTHNHKPLGGRTVSRSELRATGYERRNRAVTRPEPRVKGPEMKDEQKMICEGCNIYHVDCLGEKFEWTSGIAKKCKSQVCEPNNTPSKIQLEAFKSLYFTKVRLGTEKWEAFAEAIVQTSDDAFAVAKQKRGHLIERLEICPPKPKQR